MIKNIFLLVLLALLFWNYRTSFFDLANRTTLEHRKTEIATKPLDVYERKVNKQEVINRVQKNNIMLDASSDISLEMLLLEHRFYDALSFYLDNSSQNNMHLMENYLKKLAKTNPTLALEYMQVFLEQEAHSGTLGLMIKTYISQKNYTLAIMHIKEAIEDYKSEVEDKRLHQDLKNIAVLHIKHLMSTKSYADLIVFLEEMIAYNADVSMYLFQLAKVHMTLDKTEEAKELLTSLEYDEVYAQKAERMLEDIELEDKNEQYKYAINLRKYGGHYIVDVFLDGRPFRLMLDTGATYIYIDDEKASMLELVHSNLVLRTAAGDVSASLRLAHSMRVGDIELENIKVTTASFKRDDIDGLLGMNFLNRFTFFLDQEEGILYLNPK